MCCYLLQSLNLCSVAAFDLTHFSSACIRVSSRWCLLVYVRAALVIVRDGIYIWPPAIDLSFTKYNNTASPGCGNYVYPEQHNRVIELGHSRRHYADETRQGSRDKPQSVGDSRKRSVLVTTITWCLTSFSVCGSELAAFGWHSSSTSGTGHTAADWLTPAAL